MGGVTSSRDNENVGPHGTHMLHDLVDSALRMNGDDDARRLGETAGLQERRIGGVAIKHVMPLAAVTSDRGHIQIGGDGGNAVLLEQPAYHFADATVANDDGVVLGAGRPRHECAGRGAASAQPCRETPAGERQERCEHHRH